MNYATVVKRGNVSGQFSSVVKITIIQGKMLEKLKEINRNVNTENTASALIILALFHLINIFAFYYKTKLNLANPLIPKYLAFELFEPYAVKGIILTIGILIATFLKLFKQNLFIILVCTVIIASYYLTSFEPSFAEYQK
jgi:hypothetical protein